MLQTFTHRLAGRADIPALETLMKAAIAELQRGFLTPAQIEASRTFMGIDTQLIDDATYFVIEAGDEAARQIAGSGGWSRRATLYGGDHTPGRDLALLDPATEAARVRAMYTAPAFARQGVGRLILALAKAPPPPKATGASSWPAPCRASRSTGPVATLSSSGSRMRAVECLYR